MSNSEDDARAAADFEDMVQAAAHDGRVTGAKFSLQQARSGSYGLLGAALVCLVTALFAIFSVTLYAAVAGNPYAWNIVRIGAVVLYLLAAGGFVLLFFLARRNPWSPSIIGLTLYCILVLPSVIIIYVSALYIINFVVLIALVDGVRAAWQHRRIFQRALQDEGESPLSKRAAASPSSLFSK